MDCFARDLKMQVGHPLPSFFKIGGVCLREVGVDPGRFDSIPIGDGAYIITQMIPVSRFDGYLFPW